MTYYHNTQTASTNGILRKTTHFHQIPSQQVLQKKVWWICSKGHSYEQSINLHIIRGYSCPYCSHQKVFAGYNDLETLFPDIAKEWHPSKNAELTPSNVTAYSQKKVWWLCPMGHSYEQTVERRVRRGSACYYCSGHKVLKDSMI